MWNPRIVYVEPRIHVSILQSLSNILHFGCRYNGNLQKAFRICGSGRKSTLKWAEVIDFIDQSDKQPEQLDQEGIAYTRQIDQIMLRN
jgi:hypothetical protein